MKKLYGVSREDLAQAAELLRKGEIVALPTETVYGLACLALDANVVSKVFATKNRPQNDPLIVHVNDLSEAREVALVNERAVSLAEAFWPGPLTFVLPKTDRVPDIVTSGLPTVAVRSPAHPVFRKILSLVGAPLAAPSANPFGKVSPTDARHISESFGPDHPPVVDGGPTEVGIESTVLDLSCSTIRILRPGPVSPAEIEGILGTKPVLLGKTNDTQTPGNTQSPGLLPRHYSPTSPLRIFPDLPTLLGFLEKEEPPTPETCLLVHAPLEEDEFLPSGLRVLPLSKTGEPNEIAHNLYARLREADRRSPPLILCSLLPEEGIARAINDRLRRAAYRE
ncbi:MAG: L-threonylcarbamoyladenylate synthase [Opitutales bacterium]